MKCTIAFEDRFVLNHEGRPASRIHSYEGFRDRYLDAFDSVTVMGRLFPIAVPQASTVEGPGVTFVSLPGYSGPFQYLFNIQKLKHHIWVACNNDSAYVLRAPSPINSLIWKKLHKVSHPYGVEVVGDPHDVFAPGVIKHPLRPFLRSWISRQVRQQCARACAVAYVTGSVLQSRYRPSPGAFITSYSNVELPHEAFVEKPRTFGHVNRSVKMVSVCTFEQLYKGQDVIIEALSALMGEGMDIDMTFVGDGKQRSKMEALAAERGIKNRIRFLGALPSGDPVRSQLDKAHIFLLASRTEGLPRAMVEAMARAVPCIGSTVGGIPELLPLEDLVPPDDVTALRQKIYDVATDPERASRMSARNLDKSKEFRLEILRKRRNDFYSHVIKNTEEYIGD